MLRIASKDSSMISHMLETMSLTMTRWWNQSDSPSVGVWTNGWCIYTIEYYSVRKRNEEDVFCHIGEPWNHEGQAMTHVCKLRSLGDRDRKFWTIPSYTLNSKLAWATWVPTLKQKQQQILKSTKSTGELGLKHRRSCLPSYPRS